MAGRHSLAHERIGQGQDSRPAALSYPHQRNSVPVEQSVATAEKAEPTAKVTGKGYGQGRSPGRRSQAQALAKGLAARDTRSPMPARALARGTAKAARLSRPRVRWPRACELPYPRTSLLSNPTQGPGVTQDARHYRFPILPNLPALPEDELFPHSARSRIKARERLPRPIGGNQEEPP